MTLRSWATPLVIATFLAAGVTGLLMFFHLDVGVNKLLHEWIGLAMIAGVGAHVVLNWRAFTGYFRRPLPRVVMGLGIVLLALSFAELPGLGGGPGETVGRVMGALGGASLGQLADLAGSAPEALVGTLHAAGFDAATPDTTVGTLAAGDRAAQMRILGLAFAAK